MIRQILHMGVPSLRRAARAVPLEEYGSGPLRDLVRDMVDTMHDATGAGLAAPQIGVDRRVCILEVHQNPRYAHFPPIPLTVLVNPVVTPESDGWVQIYEGCLSVPGVRGAVRRPRRVRVEAWDAEGAPVRLYAEGVAAAIIQHETDHLDGTLFVDKADPKTLCFLPEYEKYVPSTEYFRDSESDDPVSRIEAC